MSLRFEEILARELAGCGAPAPALARTRGPRNAPVPAAPAARPDFSERARQLSLSLQNYAGDRERFCKMDSGIVAGNGQTGYILKEDGGISGRMSFIAGSGVRVSIVAGDAEQPSAEVRITAEKDGREFCFELEDLALAFHGPAEPFQAALPPGAADQDAASATWRRSAGTSYGHGYGHDSGHGAAPAGAAQLTYTLNGALRNPAATIRRFSAW